MPEHELDISKNIRTIEWLKSELVSGVSSLFKAMLKANDETILESLSSIIIGCYVLARRLGLPFNRLDLRVSDTVRQNISNGHEVERWYGDLTALSRHFMDRK